MPKVAGVTAQLVTSSGWPGPRGRDFPEIGRCPLLYIEGGFEHISELTSQNTSPRERQLEFAVGFKFAVFI